MITCCNSSTLVLVPRHLGAAFHFPISETVSTASSQMSRCVLEPSRSAGRGSQGFQHPRASSELSEVPRLSKPCLLPATDRCFQLPQQNVQLLQMRTQTSHKTSFTVSRSCLGRTEYSIHSRRLSRHQFVPRSRGASGEGRNARIQMPRGQWPRRTNSPVYTRNDRDLRQAAALCSCGDRQGPSSLWLLSPRRCA